MEVHWSPNARRDLQQIRDYIGQNTHVYAHRMIVRIVAAVENLRDFPESGGMLLEDERPQLRQIFVANYRVIYRLRPDLIEVVVVLHGARQFPEN